MINVNDSMLSLSNLKNNPSPISFTPNVTNKTSHYYDFLSNVKNNINNKNNNPSSNIKNHFKIKNYSNPKNNNAINIKNKIITKHYNISSNIRSINDKKLVSIPLIKKPIITEPSCKLEKFLPPKKTEKKTLVIDLDETLVHSYFDKYPPRKPDISFEIMLDGKNVQVYTLVRPGAIEFLEKISDLYEIVIFTASLSLYALPIINFIDKNKKCDFKLFREHCSSFNNGFIKDLKRLSRDLNNLIILDNNPNCYFLNKENAFPIKTWIDEISDKELFKIMPYLEFLSKDFIKDIRPILSKIKRGNEIIYYKFDKIIKKYKKYQTINYKNEDRKINEQVRKENNKNSDFIPNIFKNEPKEVNIQLIENDLFNKKDKENIVKENEKNNNDLVNINMIKEEKKVDNDDYKSVKDENKIMSIENNCIKNDFKNKIKTSKGNRFFISKSKNNKENYSENINLKNNLFNNRISHIQINSPKSNLINSTIKYSSRGIFLKNKENIEKKQDVVMPNLFPKYELIPFINNVNLHSKPFDKSILNNLLNCQNEPKTDNTNIKESPNKKYFKNNEYFQSPKNYDNFKYLYLYCNKTTNNFNKKNKNLLVERNIIRNNSEKKKLLYNYNYKSIEDITRNNLDEVKFKYLDKYDINANDKINRSISSYKKNNEISQKTNIKKNHNNRCLSSHQHCYKSYNNKFNP